MSDSRRHWNERYSNPGRGHAGVASFLTAMAEHVPCEGSAIDIAGGSGRNALWFARRGLDVTLADISDVALEQGAAAAREQGLQIECLQRDLERDGLPNHRLWNVALIHLYFPRLLLRELPNHIARGGVLMFCQPTVLNLQRHNRPPRRYLVEAGELESAIGAMPGMDVLECSEDWRMSHRHDAWLVARRL